nr:class I SAM-dependent methyltransferase [Agromyces seonyuensis]
MNPKWPSVSRRVVVAALAALLLLGVVGVVLAVVTGSWGPLIIGAVVDAVILLAVFERGASNERRALAASIAEFGAAADESETPYAPGTSLDLLRRDLQRDLSATLSLHAALDVERRMPAPGGWAATPDTLAMLVGLLLDRLGDAPVVVECGSGTSTVWLASALRAAGRGRLISLEHDAEWAALSRTRLLDHGLADLVDVRHAPLEAGPEGLWYAESSLGGLERIDLLFVDGPPGFLGEHARRPAYPVLGAALSPGGFVVLDDVDRPGETAIFAEWLAGGELVEAPEYATDRARVARRIG